ncbi:MAG: phosphoglucosamine mutase [Holosporaceae bacterium]|nr:phosphoglucosamine mutase [Holosporaceae bacterium]
MRKIFGTDGIRGVANEYPMTIETCLKLAKAIAIKFCDPSKNNHMVIIGKDTRISCTIFEYALTAAFCSFGIDVKLIGVIPTPAVSILTAELKANAGVMISASHNQFSDNGIKIFNSAGLKLSDQEELELERNMFDDSICYPTPIGNSIGRAQIDGNCVSFYCNKIKNSFTFKKIDAERIKIVVDCSNGALSYIAPSILRKFGFQIVSLYDSPNGININANCGTANPNALATAVAEHQADIGIAFDGDGDRVLLVDKNGNIVDGDRILAILALSEDIKHTEIVSTIMSNLAFEKYLASRQIKLIRTNVGDRYISEYMQKNEAILGGEPSGHIIVKYHSLTGDGLFAGLKVIEYLINFQKQSCDLKNIFKSYLCINENVRVKNKSIINNPKVIEKIKQSQEQLHNSGRLIVRLSGTEPIIRIYAEGDDIDELKSIVDHLVETIKKVM